MATRMQQRRGTAAQWTSANPVLNAAEMGWESDTNKFKIGDGVNHWADLDYFIDANSTTNPAFGSSIVFEGATANDFETTLAITDPTADRTITFPDATGTVALTSDIAVTASSTNTLTNKTLTSPKINEDVALTATATELNYVDGVTSAIQTQMDAKASLSGATFTGAVSGTDLTLSGNLTVNGTTTNINSTNLVVEDKNIVLGDTASPADNTADGGGITLKGTTDKTFNWVDSTDAWTSSEHIDLASGKTLKYNGTDLVASQTGNSGKYLTTNGTSTSWDTVTSYSAPTLGSTSIASGSTVTTIAGLTLSGGNIQADKPTFVTLTSDTTTAYYSTNGVTWSTTSVPTSANYLGVIYGNGNFIAARNMSTSALASTDGITWVARTTLAVPISGFTYVNNTFITSPSFSSAAMHSTDGITWNASAFPATGTWTAVSYGAEVYASLSGGTSQTTIAAYSTNGISWTQTSAPSARWSGLAFGNGVFAAVSTTGTTAASSTDGITWEVRTMPATSSAVIYGNNIFVAIGSGTTSAATSTDAVTWTLRTLPAALNRLTLGNGTFLATAGGGTAAASSTDGITWTLRTLPSNSTVSTGYGTVPVSASALSVINAASATPYSAPTIGSTSIASGATVTTIAGLTLTSPTFTTPALGTPASGTLTNATGLPISGITASTSLALGVGTVELGHATDTTLSRSAAGVLAVEGVVVPTISSTSTLTNKTISAGTLTGTLTAGGGVGSSGQVLSSTGSGVQWSAAAAPASVAGVRATTPIQAKGSFYNTTNHSVLYRSPAAIDTAIDTLAVTNMSGTTEQVRLYLTSKSLANPTLVSVGGNGNTSTAAAASTDGITWEVRTMPANVDWRGSAYGNNVFVAVSLTSSAASSTDGITWTLRTSASAAGWKEVVFGNGTFVSQLSGSGASCQTSTDGITWTTRALAKTQLLNYMAYGNGLFAAVQGGSSATDIQYSTNGITWSLKTMPFSATWGAMGYGAGNFVIVAANSTTAAYSTNAVTWTVTTLPAASNWSGVTYGNNKFVAVATGTTNAATSTDGITWTVTTTTGGFQWLGVSYQNGSYYITSSGQTVNVSTDAVTWTARTMPTFAGYNDVMSNFVEDKEIIYKNVSVASNSTVYLDASPQDPIFVPAGYSIIPQTTSSSVNFMASGEKWSNN